MKSTWALIGALALGVLAPAALPGLVAAEPNAVLYEVTENMKIAAGRLGNARLAMAALSGHVKAGTSICPTWLAEKFGQRSCTLTALAVDKIKLSTGAGPVVGTFNVNIQGDNPVDGAELTVALGQLTGTIDLSPALGGTMPLGSLKGTWSATGTKGGLLAGVRMRGTLTGVFRLPFVYGVPQGCLDDGNPSDCVYVSPPSYATETGMVELAPREYSLGVPTVKLEITFADQQ